MARQIADGLSQKAIDPIYTRDKILGTVSQSGGVPTGAIIERGSNSNGEYVKYADGTLICTQEASYTVDVDVLDKGVYVSRYIGPGLPHAFVDDNYGIAAQLTGANTRGMWVGGNSDAKVASTARLRLCCNESQVGGTYSMAYIAIGRWF